MILEAGTARAPAVVALQPPGLGLSSARLAMPLLVVALRLEPRTEPAGTGPGRRGEHECLACEGPPPYYMSEVVIERERGPLRHSAANRAAVPTMTGAIAQARVLPRRR